MEPEMERELERLERKYEREITEVYNQAASDVTKKWEKYTADFARKDAVKKKLVEAGELSKEDYAKWRKGQILIGKRWREQVDVLSRDLVNADQIAVSLTRGYMAEAYALGHNYGTFLVEKGSLVNTSYTLYSRETVERLIKDQPRLLNVTKWELNHPKDMHWNQRHITDQITQGILQGEDIRQVSKRLQNVTGMDKGAAMRNARTAMTGAQNSGRMDAYERAAEMGIELEKEWVATMDSHTRDSHIDMDGEHIPVDAVFSNGVSFPGEAGGPPAEVYNCRCTLIPRLADVDYSKDNDLRWRRDEDLDGMSYDEWKESRGGKYEVESKAGDWAESLRSVAENATDKYDFWMSLDENQLSIFKASGMSLDDVYNNLHGSGLKSEWKSPNPGGAESFSISANFKDADVKFEKVRPKTDGWMADANVAGTINVRNDGLGEDWKFIIGHEAGHQLCNFSSEVQQMVLYNPGNVLGRYNTRLMAFDGVYGEYNPEEAFATCVSRYMSHPSEMREKYPDAYSAIDNLFSASPSAKNFVERALSKYEREFL